MSQSPLSPEPSQDDVDRLFTRMDALAPPADFTARVLSQTVLTSRTQADRRAAALWGLVACVCLLGLGVSGYVVGTQFASADGLLLIQAISDDVSLLALAPGDVMGALSESVPWALVIVSGLCAGVLSWAAGQVASALTRPSNSAPSASV